MKDGWFVLSFEGVEFEGVELYKISFWREFFPKRWLTECSGLSKSILASLLDSSRPRPWER